MKICTLIFTALVLLKGTTAPPVTSAKPQVQEDEIQNLDLIHYSKYLKEVVELLEKDQHFRQRLENATDDDIRSGKVAEDLDFVHHSIRTQLDEKKRQEIERLRHLIKREHMDENFSVHGDFKDHLVPENIEFGKEDLKRLIQKTANTLEEADRARREEFKYHKMQQKAFEEEKLKNMTDAEKYTYEQEERRKQHYNHVPVHHPGSKQQLEEVWEQQDHMDEKFDPKLFFAMHDLDGNNVWDQDEVKTLFIKELDKLYKPEDPSTDPMLRREEMERMREHVFFEYDLNRDGVISFDEFASQVGTPQFQKDEGWQPISDNEVYTNEEYNEFKRRQDMHHMQQGMVHHQNVPVPPQYHQQHYPDQFPPQGYPHPGQGYPSAQANYQPQGYHPSQVNQQPPQGYQAPQVNQNPPPGYQSPQVNQLPAQSHPSAQGNLHPPQGYQSPQGNQQPSGYEPPQVNQPAPQNHQTPQVNQNAPQSNQLPQANQQNPQQGHQNNDAVPQSYQQSSGNQPLQSNQPAQNYQQEVRHPAPSNYNQQSNEIKPEQPSFQSQGGSQPQKKPLAAQNANSYQVPIQGQH